MNDWFLMRDRLGFGSGPTPPGVEWARNGRQSPTSAEGGGNFLGILGHDPLIWGAFFGQVAKATDPLPTPQEVGVRSG